MAPTAVSPSSIGTPAATSEPKATTRMSSVIGSDSVSARVKSWPSERLSAWLALASPNSSIRSDGWSRAVAAVAPRTRVTSPSLAELEADERRVPIT